MGGLAHLPDGESGKPKRDETILAEWQPIVGMSDDLQNESSIPASVLQRAGGRPTDGQSA